ncbi:hypothetical protein [Paulownia witches'-broom phytoplasma]|uniref:hypothetical protein n=1 Tax=Paulownia witches'-broom phytoplasma TaxID=39647 RepID=UPI0021F25E06|nr:hypothetical protein [Paulownia witches'-broom phytoplasma]
MNDLNFSIGFIVGALFTTSLMFIIKKIFFNFLPSPENDELNEPKKENKTKSLFSIITNPNNESKEKNNPINEKEDGNN